MSKRGWTRHDPWKEELCGPEGEETGQEAAGVSNDGHPHWGLSCACHLNAELLRGAQRRELVLGAQLDALTWCTLHTPITGGPVSGHLCARWDLPPTSLASPHPQAIRCLHLHPVPASMAPMSA